MKRRSLTFFSIALVSFLMGTMVSSTASALDVGPFKDIWKAITGIQTRVDTLEAELEALKARVEVLEAAHKPPVTFLEDRFDTGLDNWNYWEKFSDYSEGYPKFSGYTLQWVPSAAMMSGDGFSVFVGMEKVVDLSEWNQSWSLLLSFDWRATSDTPDSGVTNTSLMVQDADSGSSLYQKNLLWGGTVDTGWQGYANDISSYVIGHSRITVILYLTDGWIDDWHQTNTYDNIELTSTTSP